VVFTSDRGGNGVFSGRESVRPQRAFDRRAREDDPCSPQPDGAWVLYVETSATASGHIPLQRLMRVPVNGGLPKLVFEITTAWWQNHECARSRKSLRNHRGEFGLND